MTTTLLALFALCICIIAALYDFIALKLPNILMVALLALYSQLALTNYFLGQNDFYPQLAVAGGLFILTTILFFIGILGGGDAKMMSVMGLWIGIQGVAIFLLVMSCVGFILGIIALGLRNKIKNNTFYNRIPILLRPKHGWLASLHKGENALPYGIAITSGVIAAFISNGYLNTLLT